MKKPIRLEVVIGATLGLIGIFLIFLPEFDKISLQQGAVFGVLFGAASFFCAAVGNVLSEKILEGKVTVSQMNFWAMTYGVSCSALVVLITGQSIQLPTTGSYYLALLYLAVFGSVIAFGAYMRLLKQIGSDKSAYVVLVYPIVALIISTVFEDYQWTLYSIAGVIIVLIGNAIAMGKLNRQLRIAEVSN